MVVGNVDLVAAWPCCRDVTVVVIPSGIPGPGSGFLMLVRNEESRSSLRPNNKDGGVPKPNSLLYKYMDICDKLTHYLHTNCTTFIQTHTYK